MGADGGSRKKKQKLERSYGPDYRPIWMRKRPHDYDNIDTEPPPILGQVTDRLDPDETFEFAAIIDYKSDTTVPVTTRHCFPACSTHLYVFAWTEGVGRLRSSSCWPYESVSLERHKLTTS